MTEDSIKIDEEVPVVLEKPILWETVYPIVAWYRENKRDTPWRHDVTPYRVWVSEIMLQQTRVEAVKPYYDRFLKELPTITDLANAKRGPADEAVGRAWILQPGPQYAEKLRSRWLSSMAVSFRNHMKKSMH